MKMRLTQRATWPKGIAAEAEKMSTYRGSALALAIELAEQNGGYIDEYVFVARARKLDLGSATPHDFWNWMKRTGICR
jgi:hypothetical protein